MTSKNAEAPQWAVCGLAGVCKKKVVNKLKKGLFCFTSKNFRFVTFFKFHLFKVGELNYFLVEFFF